MGYREISRFPGRHARSPPAEGRKKRTLTNIPKFYIFLMYMMDHNINLIRILFFFVSFSQGCMYLWRNLPMIAWACTSYHSKTIRWQDCTSRPSSLVKLQHGWLSLNLVRRAPCFTFFYFLFMPASGQEWALVFFLIGLVQKSLALA